MNSLQVHQQKAHQPREKRLKVSRACFTCRVKKIKCDGVQPCMQCKARRRPCSFSKDGTVDETQSSPDAYPANVPAMQDERHSNQRRRSLSHSPRSDSSRKRPLPVDDSNQQPNEASLERKSKEQHELNKTFQQLEKLSMMWPGEGKEGRWLVDINLLFNGAEETTNNEPTQPSPDLLNLNNNLLALFFRHRHSIFPILPKTIFYRLLEHRDALITPLLLNSMYCIAAQYSHEEAAEADAYFKKAQVLLDSYIDTPSLSLVISLCLLSTFESNRCGSGPHAGRSKARIYRDMACRMCYDLKLHQRYSFHNSGATLDDNELRKRVYWVCYCLDKVQSLVTGKPYLLSSKDIDIDFPVVLGTDDTNEFEINTCFVEHIKLMQISERVLELEIPDRQAGMLRSPENEQLVLDLDGQLLYWLRNLPQQLQWTPLNTNSDMIPTQPPANALVAHLHLVFNFLEISVLQPIASTSLSSSPASLMIQQRCASVATNLTQLSCAMADQPNFIMSFTLISEAIMAAVRVHIMNCADEKLNTARHARFMFQRSLRSMRVFLHHRVLDRVQEFVTTIEKALVDADTGNSNSRNSSPKIHVLSPIIPRTTTSTHNNMVDPYSNMDDRWPARANNNNGLMPYGLVSPTSSTASAPLEKSTMSRDEEVARPHSSLSQINNVYSHLSASTTSTTSMPTSAPLMDPYSRPASFNIPTTSSSTPSAWRSPAISSNKSQQQQQQQQQQPNQDQQMEMYSNIWSRTSLDNGLQQFSSDHLDNSFINSTRQHIKHENQEKQLFEASAPSTSTALQSNSFNATSTAGNNTPNTQMNADSELYSLWDQQAHKNTPSQQQEQQQTMLTSQPQTTARYGLGVYASAQQHHTDVIRQHMPNLKSSNSNRPVLLNHHGQVVVAGATQNYIK